MHGGHYDTPVVFSVHYETITTIYREKWVRHYKPVSRRSQDMKKTDKIRYVALSVLYNICPFKALKERIREYANISFPIVE